MRKGTRIMQAVAIGLCAAIICAAAHVKQPEFVQIEEETCALSDSLGTLIQHTEDDLTVIPDKYNTGAKGELCEVKLGDIVGQVQLKVSGNGINNVFDLKNYSTYAGEIIRIENYDFSKYPVVTYNEDMLNKPLKIIFKNCKFSRISKAREGGALTYEFENCTINNFVGSDAIFDRCYLGQSYYDGLNVFRNIEVTNCYFAEQADSNLNGEGYHTDGAHIFGYKDVDVYNVHFENCRFEMPSVNSINSINSCMMLQLEYSNGSNISYTDCIVNGGGYSICARAIGEWQLSDVVYDDIKVGCSRKFGALYPDVSSGVKIGKISETDSLYVASVWKEDGKTHFSVSNDTMQDRELTIYTDKGIYKFSVAACPYGDKMSMLSNYEQFPFDLDIVIPEDCLYAVCYDTTLDEYGQQVRFINWTENTVYIDSRKIQGTADEVVLDGECGSDVQFILTKDGVLTLQGSGATYSYHSKRIVPWANYTNMIKKVVVEEGIDTLGSTLFQNCISLTEIKLPETLVEIKERAFAKCIALRTIVLPKSVTMVASTAFLGTFLESIYCTVEQRDIVVDCEDVTKTLIVVADEFKQEQKEIIVSGKCGATIEYELTADGIMTLKGYGNTYNYHSKCNAPWKIYSEQIREVRVMEGITKLGNQLFAECSNLSRVSLPKTLQGIGRNVFIRCKELRNIKIPENVSMIESYAFAATGLCDTTYAGSQEKWKSVQVEKSNEPLCRNMIFLK